ncbi:MAG: hypothetical protein ABUS54_00560 [Actinomycetota bacterium]
MLALVAAAALAITGQAQQGQKLTTTVPTGTTVQWYRCAPDVSHCSSIHGATAASYTLGAKDVGKTITVNAKASDATMSYASAVGPVAATAAKLAPTAQPAVTGTTTVGQVLTVSNGSWSSAPKGYTYAWLRCNANGRICIAIASATGTTYVPTADDVGHTLVARVTASNGSVAQPTLSTMTTAVTAPAGPVASVQPSITGTAQQGQRLVAASGTWTGSVTVTFAYQWYRCDALISHCNSIHGATGPGYKLSAADAGKTITLTLKAKDTVATVTVYLSAIGPVAATASTLVSTVQPKLTATATQLTVDDGTWAASPSTFTYAWLRCNANGRLCTAIAGATTQTYALTADDQGHSIVATVDGVLSTRS